jgi:hypothetical protein
LGAPISCVLGEQDANHFLNGVSGFNRLEIKEFRSNPTQKIFKVNQKEMLENHNLWGSKWPATTTGGVAGTAGWWKTRPNCA